jgi:hypothetical protein
MPVYLFEMPDTVPVEGGFPRSLVIAAGDASAALQAVLNAHGTSPYDWNGAGVTVIEGAADLSGWKIAVAVVEVIEDPEGPSTYVLLFEHVYVAGAETMGEALDSLVTELQALQTEVEDPEGPSSFVDVPITPGLSGSAGAGWTVTVAAGADGLGDSVLKVGFFLPGSTVDMAGDGGAYGVSSLVTDMEYEGLEGSALTFSTVGSDWTIPGDPVEPSDGGDADPPPVDGDPPAPSVGADPRGLPGGSPALHGWYRSDQLVARVAGRDGIQALGDMQLPTAELRNMMGDDEHAPGYVESSAHFNGYPAVSVAPPGGFMRTNQGAGGLGQYANAIDLHEFFIVREVSAGDVIWVDGRVDNKFAVKKYDSSHVRVRNSANTGWVCGAEVPTDGSAFLLEIYWNNSGGGFVRVNGGAKIGNAAIGSGPVDTRTIGTSGGFGARAALEFAEYIRLGGELDDTGGGLGDLYAYLADRYDLTIDAPVS